MPELHAWVDESGSDRKLDPHTYILAAALCTHQRPRRATLTRLFHELDDLGVAHAILESRGPADDARDRTLHERLRRTRQIGGGLKVSHTPGPADAGLWIADAVCSAVSSSRTGHPEYLETLGQRVTVVTVVTVDRRGNRV